MKEGYEVAVTIPRQPERNDKRVYLTFFLPSFIMSYICRRFKYPYSDQPATTYTSTQNMTAGTHLVTVEYYERGENAVMKLNWLP